uniref:Uncharacterized protein n=1 Tax=Brassica oleracea var. oleracea TaxID=109376 RepID=A0A0D3AAP0_BRAOL
MPRSEHIAVVTFYKVDHSSLPDASSLVEKLCDPNAKCASKWCIHTRRYNVNIGILDTENGIDSSPTSQSPGFSLFSISLSSDDGSLNTSQHPIG